ncbi:hypothetical protein ACOSP7_032205 [Xanthoceras sorbifolium]
MYPLNQLHHRSINTLGVQDTHLNQGKRSAPDPSTPALRSLLTTDRRRNNQQLDKSQTRPVHDPQKREGEELLGREVQGS